jgi:hypothetical protein
MHQQQNIRQQLKTNRLPELLKAAADLQIPEFGQLAQYTALSCRLPSQLNKSNL